MVAHSERPDGATTVGDDRHPQAARAGKPLDHDRFSQPPRPGRIGPDEHDPEPVTELRELGVVGRELAANPCGVRAACPQRMLGPAVVQARGLVGVAHEPRVPVGLRVQRDHTEGILAIDPQLADGVHDPHRRLAATDNRQA